MDAGEGQPPSPADAAGWGRLVDAGRLGDVSLESIVIAVQTIGVKGDRRTLNELMKHLSDQMLRILWQTIGRNHLNEGEDMVERAHGDLIEAILLPQSADGIGLREAFRARVEFRAADAIRVERLKAKRYLYAEDEGVLPEQRKQPWSGADEEAHVQSVLRLIKDPRKRLAFNLHMQGLPRGPKNADSISAAVGVSAKTVGEWIAEVQSQLGPIVGEEQ